MIRPLHRFTAVLVLAASLAAVSGCAAAAPEAAPTATTAPTAAAPSATPEPEATSDTAAAASEDPTCETIISPSVVSDFEALGWTNFADAFTVGTVTLPEGVQCTWGDLSASAEEVQQFGWAPITAALAATAQQDLLAEGWSTEDSTEGVYVTESADTAAATDDEGYGRTYLFGDDWVKYADTKQSLLLVQFPQS